MQYQLATERYLPNTILHNTIVKQGTDKLSLIYSSLTFGQSKNSPEPNIIPWVDQFVKVKNQLNYIPSYIFIRLL